MIITASNTVFARRIVRPRIRVWNYCRFHVVVASATKRSRNETSADHNINYKAQFCYNGFSLRQIRTQSDSNHAHRGDEEYHASRALRFLQENQPNVVVHVENVQLAAIKLLPRIADAIVQSTPVRIKVLTHVDMISDAALQQQIQTVQQMDDRIRLPNQQPLAIFALNLQSLELTMRELSEVRDALFGASLLVSRPQIVVCGAPNSGKSSFIYPLTRHRTVMEKKKGAYHLPRVSSKAGMTLGVKKHWLPPAFGSRIKHNIALLDMPGFRPKLLFADPNLVSFLLSAGVTEPFQGYQDIVSHEAMVKLLLKAVNRHATMTDPNSVPEYVELLNLTKATEDADLFLRSYDKWAKTLPNDVLDQVTGHSKDLKSIYWPRLFKSGIFGGLVFTPYPTLPQPSQSSHIVINRDSPVVYMNEQARRLMNIGRGKEEASKVTERNKMNPKSLNSSNVESDPDLRLVPVIYAPHQRSFKCMQCAEFIKVDRDGSVFGRRHGRVVDWAFNDMLSYFSRMSEAFGGIFSKRTRYLFKDSLACTLAIKHKLRSRAAAYKKFKGLKDYPIPNHLRPKRFQIDQPIPFVHSCTRKIASCRAMTKQEISKETKRLARMNASDHTIALQRARGIPIRRPRQDRPKKLVLRPDGTPVARPSYFQEECIATTVGALSAVPRYDKR